MSVRVDLGNLTPERHRALYDLHCERERQEFLRINGRFAKTCASPDMEPAEALAVLMEEVGEVARAVLERGRLANDSHNVNLRKELVQVAAVAVAWIEKLDAESES